MAESKQVKADKAEVQKKVDTETDKGYEGTGVDPLPNSAYSLESGPESPTVAEQREALKKASNA